MFGHVSCRVRCDAVGGDFQLSVFQDVNTAPAIGKERGVAALGDSTDDARIVLQAYGCVAQSIQLGIDQLLESGVLDGHRQLIEFSDVSHTDSGE